MLAKQKRPVGSTCHQTHPLFQPNLLGRGLEHKRENDCYQSQMGRKEWYLIQVLGPFHCVTSEGKGWQETVEHE